MKVITCDKCGITITSSNDIDKLLGHVFSAGLELIEIGAGPNKTDIRQGIQFEFKINLTNRTVNFRHLDICHICICKAIKERLISQTPINNL